jgi:hypothetical protein
LAVLLERGEGYDYETAYETGGQAFLYIPLPGDEMNLLWTTAGTGTGDSLTVGQIGSVEDGTGFIVDTTGETEPFMAMEALADTTATGTLAWVIYSGY